MYLSILGPLPSLASYSPSPGQQVIEEQRRRLAELKQKAAAEAQCQWEALHGSHTQLSSSLAPLLVHHSILHHTAPSAGEDNYDTLSLESSDSIDTSVSTSNNSACSPDNMSRFEICIHTAIRVLLMPLLYVLSLELIYHASVLSLCLLNRSSFLQLK